MGEQTKAIISSLVSIVIIVAGMFGLNLSEDIVTTVVTAIIMLAVLVYDIWKNHNFTSEAGLAQRVLNSLKAEVLTDEQVEKLLEEVAND